MQLIDAWNNVPHAPGSRTVGGKGGNFVIVGPSWNGALPAGVTELRIPTNLALIGGRTYTANKDDYAAVGFSADHIRSAEKPTLCLGITDMYQRPCDESASQSQ